MPAWAARTAKDRAGVLRRWFELIMAAQEDLARIMTAEQGKPWPRSRGEIAYGASFIEWFAEEAKRLYGDVIPSHHPNKRILILQAADRRGRRDHTWNFPNAMITRKCAPALAAGCGFVIKPAQETPLSALALAELAHRAGLPAGIFNVVPSTRSIGGRPAAHPTPGGAQILLHRLDRDRQAADDPVRRHGEEGFDGAGRQRALHRLRRRRSGRRRRGRAGVQIPQHGPDLRLRQPLPGAGRPCTTPFADKLTDAGADDEGRRRRRGRRRSGTADQHGGGGESRGAARPTPGRLARKFAVGGHRHRARRHLVRAHHRHRRARRR